MSAAANPPADFSKFTVPQLKALCKERKLSGYSKLGKTALVQLLTEVNGNGSTSKIVSLAVPASGIANNSGDTAMPPVVKSQMARRPKAHTEKKLDPNVNKNIELSALNATSIEICASVIPVTNNPDNNFPTSPVHRRLTSQFTSSVSSQLQPDSVNKENNTPFSDRLDTTTLEFADDTIQASLNASSTSGKDRSSASNPPTKLSSISATTSLKRSLDDTSSQQASKKAKSTHIPSSLGSPGSPSLAVSSGQAKVSSSENTSTSTSLAQSLNSSHSRQIQSGAVPNLLGPGNTQTLKTAKRFKPLIINKPLVVPPTVSSSTSKKLKKHSPVAPLVLRYLDFPLSSSDNALILKPISMPPSLSQRSRVKPWSIILSGLRDEETRQCILVSKLFRYAVYLSASSILSNKFNGKRLQEINKRYNPSVINYWPYLRLRQHEAFERRKQFDDTFLGRVFKGATSIDDRLWGSPDTEKQIGIIVRFVLTRFWFTISLGDQGIKGKWLDGTVVDAQEVIPNEIWGIKVRHSGQGTGRIEVFYVLESTCEAVGRAQNPEDCNVQAENDTQLRADWSMFIQRRVSGTFQGSLLSYLKWEHHEEYEKGISKLWLVRIKKEAEVGEIKREIAERYVLACVVGNSVSGSWMTSAEMAQEFASLPVKTDSQSMILLKRKDQNVNLYLPGHHHVESVHFNVSSSGEPLHPALAIIQTPHREYMILRDNGMTVGCEEDGVSEVWMRMLGCDRRGVEVVR
ncbi:hypothetical protein C8Q75DRAFT_769503 [Abortiporus biennis]|nr:hypothetical protein C8Q75DRAFT_769503 [Abortiporus biennis]